MEITKMLTISTAHISKETYFKLETTCKSEYDFNAVLGIIGYKKDNYGFFIYISEYFEDEIIPDDLRNCMKFAKENDCTWLCLDCDGEEIKELNVYTW